MGGGYTGGIDTGGGGGGEDQIVHERFGRINHNTLYAFYTVRHQVHYTPLA